MPIAIEAPKIMKRENKNRWSHGTHCFRTTTNEGTEFSGLTLASMFVCLRYVTKSIHDYQAERTITQWNACRSVCAHSRKYVEIIPAQWSHASWGRRRHLQILVYNTVGLPFSQNCSQHSEPVLPSNDSDCTQRIVFIFHRFYLKIQTSGYNNTKYIWKNYRIHQ